MNISIVIPVYNEADRLAACLKAISNQIIQPLEVIVVDNNSTDRSVDVANSFNFVTLLYESKQGVTHARNKGFNLASGDIIGRIDADTILPPDWTQKIEKLFLKSTVSAVSGVPNYYDFPLNKFANKIDKLLRSHLANKLGNQKFLWGANMAVRKSDWLKVRHKLCNIAHLHEDFDLAIHLQYLKFKVDYNSQLIAGVSSRRIDTSFKDFIKYTLVNPGTYAKHDLKSRFHMYPVLIVCWVVYAPARMIFRSYNHKTQTYSLKALFTASQPRVDPTTNIIN